MGFFDNITVSGVSSSPPPEPSPEQQARIDEFARVTGLAYRASMPDPIHRGTPLTYGRQLPVRTVFRTLSGRATEFGNFSYAWPVAGDHALAYRNDYAYLAIQLDRALPHISLQAKGSPVLWDTTAGFPVGPDLTQRFELEGDFRKHFYFYCPRGYETDALYVFTPDVMALFIDFADTLDAEIIDDWVIIYRRTPLAPGDVASYERFLTVARVLGDKLQHQTDGYRDDRVGNVANNVVTPQGRRLQRRTPWQVALIVAGFTAAVFAVFGLLAGLFALVAGFLVL